MQPAVAASIAVRPVQMSREDVLAVLDSLDEPAPEPTSGSIAHRRKNERVSCRRHGIVVKGPIHYAVYLRNVCDEGAAFLHGGMIHRGTPCTLLVLQRDGKLLKAPGSVARCRHVSGMVYEVGLRFDRPIDPARLAVAPTTSSGADVTRNTEPCK